MTKREIIERILAAWESQPQIRLGQLLENARISVGNTDIYFIRDEILVDALEEWLGLKK